MISLTPSELTKKPILLLVGRSNTGKSSLCRILAPWEKKRIKVGKKPGVTQKNLRIETLDYTIIDMPGFGYMETVSHKQEIKVQEEIILFIQERHDEVFLALEVINLPEFRRIHEKYKDISVPFDNEMLGFLLEFNIPTVIIANKIDKLKKNMLQEELDYLVSAMEIESSFVYPVSTRKKIGISDVKNVINQALEDYGKNVT